MLPGTARTKSSAGRCGFSLPTTTIDDYGLPDPPSNVPTGFQCEVDPVFPTGEDGVVQPAPFKTPYVHALSAGDGASAEVPHHFLRAPIQIWADDLDVEED